MVRGVYRFFPGLLRAHEIAAPGRFAGGTSFLDASAPLCRFYPESGKDFPLVDLQRLLFLSAHEIKVELGNSSLRQRPSDCETNSAAASRDYRIASF